MKQNIMLEVVPPHKRYTKEQVEKRISNLVESISRMESVSIIDVPEIVEENYKGLPYYRNMDSREYALLLKDKCKKDILVNKVVVHFASKQEFELWLDQSIAKYGIKNFVFVGGNFNFQYSGPSVLEANRIAKSKNVNFGNIVIPARPNEVIKTMEKTLTGAKFFTTQILFESNTILNLLENYQEACAISNVKPATFYLSFAPVADREDIEFVKWLGADFEDDYERKLRTSANISSASLEIIKGLIQKIKINCEQKNITIPLRINVEQVTFRNLDNSERLINEICDLDLLH